MDRKDAIAYLRAVKTIMQESTEARETAPYLDEALEVAIGSMEKLEEVGAWLQAQEAGFLAGDAGATKREKV